MQAWPPLGKLSLGVLKKWISCRLASTCQGQKIHFNKLILYIMTILVLTPGHTHSHIQTHTFSSKNQTPFFTDTIFNFKWTQSIFIDSKFETLWDSNPQSACAPLAATISPTGSQTHSVIFHSTLHFHCECMFYLNYLIEIYVNYTHNTIIW